MLLTWDPTNETVTYMFELGIGGVLVKPASANRVIREMARSIDPPGEFKQLMERCDKQLVAREYDLALKTSDKILFVNPESARGLTLRGEALMGIGKTDQAIRSFMDAHESRPIYLRPLSNLAAAFRKMEDQRALDYLVRLDELSPLNPDRKIEIAQEFLRSNATNEAEAYLDLSVETMEREAASMIGDLTVRIVDAISQVAPDLAVKYLKRIIETKRKIGTEDLIHFNRLGIILRGQGKWEEAVDAYKQALEIAPGDSILHYNMGLAYREGEKRLIALRCFEDAIGYDGLFYVGRPSVTLNIGTLYLELRNYADAEYFLEQVVDMEPRNEIAQNRLRLAQQKSPLIEPFPLEQEHPSNVSTMVKPAKKRTFSLPRFRFTLNF
jgi:tetratricopeptide (TPR) repeat protein